VLSLLDEVFPRWDVRERDGVPLATPPQRALRRGSRGDGATPLVRELFRLRGLRRTAASNAPLFDQMVATGFRVLAEDEPEVVVASSAFRLQRDRNESDQARARKPSRVTLTSRRTAAFDGRLLAAVRAWRQ
jgi:hypothetical protein